MSLTLPWPAVRNAEVIASPALLIDEARMDRNIASMLAIAGGPGRLRPHLKTHKLPEVVERQVRAGITMAKVATIAEAEMAAVHGVQDILLALQPVGPAAHRLARLAVAHPHVRWSAVVDAPGPVHALSQAAVDAGAPVIGAWIDLDVGQHRTGVVPGAEAEALCEVIRSAARLEFRGLHAYDGHLGIADPEQRAAACNAAYEPVEALRARLDARHVTVPSVLAGGSPTFAIHARRPGVELSPGTTVLWDAGYGSRLTDLPFEPAAFLLARVVSRPAPDCICLDLGHKAVASEMPQPRALFPELPDAEVVSHSEEHLVLRTGRAPELPPGSVLYAIPWHVCPTVALHQEVWIVRDAVAQERWTVEARARRLSV